MTAHTRSGTLTSQYVYKYNETFIYVLLSVVEEVSTLMYKQLPAQSARGKG